jgi:hypothetical protein
LLSDTKELCYHAQLLLYPTVQLIHSVVTDKFPNTKFSRPVILKNKALQYHVLGADMIEQITVYWCSDLEAYQPEQLVQRCPVFSHAHAICICTRAYHVTTLAWFNCSNFSEIQATTGYSLREWTHVAITSYFCLSVCLPNKQTYARVHAFIYCYPLT